MTFENSLNKSHCTLSADFIFALTSYTDRPLGALQPCTYLKYTKNKNMRNGHKMVKLLTSQIWFTNVNLRVEVMPSTVSSHWMIVCSWGKRHTVVVGPRYTQRTHWLPPANSVHVENPDEGRALTQTRPLVSCTIWSHWFIINQHHSTAFPSRALSLSNMGGKKGTNHYFGRDKLAEWVFAATSQPK